jgi:hypothetical protein
VLASLSRSMDKIDPSICPVCGEQNACGMSQGKSECWCTNVKIAPEALARVPRAAQNLACLCTRCAGEARVREPA